MSNNKAVKLKLQAALKSKGYGLLSLKNAFNQFDVDHSGNLSWDEFVSALQSCGVTPNPSDLRSLFLELDADGNGEVSYGEFIATMRGELSPQVHTHKFVRINNILTSGRL